MIEHLLNRLIVYIRKANELQITFFKKVSLKQIIGFILILVGVYLVATSIQTILLVCGHCEKGPPLGWLGILNPALGLASLAEEDGAAFKFYVLWPLIGGILLIIIGAIMVILCRKRTSSNKDQEKRT